MLQLKERNGSRLVVYFILIATVSMLDGDSAVVESEHIMLTWIQSHSRQALKKYIQANNNINVPSTKTFDSLFNRTLKAGVDSGDFAQPKGRSHHFILTSMPV